MTSEGGWVLGELHPTDPVYAVLDGARDRRIKAWIDSTQAPAWCLYRGELHPDLAAAAPYLLRLGRGHAYTEQFFGTGWRNAWGILFASAAPVAELRRHLRRFLRARTEQGRILAFRYYDPRVLRLYLPTCTPAELDTLFGPITALVAEAKAKDRFHHYRAGARGLEARLVEVPQHGAAAPGQRPAGVAAQVPPRGARPRSGLWTIRDAQLEALRRARERELGERILDAMRLEFPSECARLGDEALQTMLETADRKGAAFRFAEPEEVALYLEAMFLLGAEFDELPRNRWALAILGDRDLDARTRLTVLVDQARARTRRERRRQR